MLGVKLNRFVRCFAAVLAVVVAGGCANLHKKKSHKLVLERASEDLKCPEQQVSAELKDSERFIGGFGTRELSYETSGCGRKLAYQVTCGGAWCPDMSRGSEIEPAEKQPADAT